MSSTQGPPAPRPFYLCIDGRTPKARGHFALFLPNSPSKSPPGSVGTVIHVVGNPLLGFFHEFKRNFNTADAKWPGKAVLLGYLLQDVHQDPESEGVWIGNLAEGVLEREALEVEVPPRGDVRAPVDGVVNKRCQEWTMEYLRRLVELGYLEEGVIRIAQEQRDPPTHGIMLRPGTGEKAALGPS
ncbi:hypothetical protein C8A05DRAFT_36168 [Staphylotrichum tortipilum]|uniref:Uncharacterized protein n=1 Tax=Staphylotrichum tortipilum TaxID=2831512 RepID=A0AAN6MGM0_9PEZI|nr:hypothetical protein C8A05DRAFT_36168 [Staphylotrichum longicolle]